MNNYFDAISKSIESQNWYAALILALVMPDICSKIEFPNQYPSKRYPNWFDKYSLNKYKNHLSGQDCYALRCSMIHEGHTNIELQNARKYINRFSFTPNSSHLISIRGIRSDSLDSGKHLVVLSTKKFSEDIVISCKSWLEECW